MSVPWSAKGSKANPVAADEVVIIDSEDANLETQNKRVLVSNFLGGGLASINGDTTPAQLLAGTSARITVVDAGDLHTFNISTSYAGQTSITTLGTIITGVWNGDDIALGNIVNGAANEIIKTNAGGTALEFGLIVNTNIDASAAIDFSKLASLSDGNILIGNAANVATSITMSGDATISNTGVLSITNDVIDNAKIEAHISSKITINAKGQLNSNIVYTDQANTYGDFLQTFKDDQLKINSPDDADGITFVNSNQTADRNLTIPILTDNRSMVVTGEASQITLGAEVIGAITNLSDVTAKTGTGTTVVFDTSPTITTPTIASFTNATHDHSDAAGGGQLTNSALISGVFSAITGIGTQIQIIDMGNNKITDVTDPTLAQDAATKNYVDTSSTSIWTKSGVNIFPTTLTDKVGIGTDTPMGALEVVGESDFRFTATTSDMSAQEITVDADSFGDIKGLNIAYTTGVLLSSDDNAIVLINIDESDSTSGILNGLEILTTNVQPNTQKIGMKLGIGIDPINQSSGTFVDAVRVLVNAVNQTTALSSGGAGNVSVFVADNDTVTIGSTAKFEEIEFIVDTVATDNGIVPVFEFSTGVGTWGIFTPTDGTNGFRNTGSVSFEDSLIPTWAVGANSEFLIRITRTADTLTTSPILDLIQISAVDIYFWDESGTVSIQTLELNNPASTFQYIFTGDAITADRILNLPLLVATDTIVVEAFAQTLTNKSINLANNTLSGTSAELATAISDETGTGSLVFATSPTFSGTVALPIVSVAGNMTHSARNLEDKGSDISSTNDITLGSDGNYFDITGTTTINTISGTGWQSGAEVVLQFDDALTVTNNSGGTNDIITANGANISTATGFVLGLRFDGVDWIETFRNTVGGGDALTSNPLSQFAATTSAQLAGVMTDETGTGSLVFGSSPTLATPVIADFTNADHDHEDIAGGSVLVATLALTATGTKDGTTFLRGDDTWSVPAGAGDMVLATPQTVTGAKTFGTIGGAVGKFILAGSTSGSTIVNAAAVAGATTMTFPGSSGTVVITGLASQLTIGTEVTGASTALTDTATIARSTNNLSFFAATTSAQLASVITNETGTGSLVFGSSPTFSGTVALPIVTVSGNMTHSGRNLEDKGADVVSANIMTLGTDGNYFDITGTTQIDEIVGTGWQAGSEVVLQFDDSLTVTNDSGGTNDIITANGVNISTVAGFVLGLRFDGTDWIETFRNSIASAAQTPWTSDIDADGFDLTDLSNIEFRETTGLPAGTVPYIAHEATGITINVPTGNALNIDVNGNNKFAFNATQLGMAGLNLSSVGTITLQNGITLDGAAGQLEVNDRIVFTEHTGQQYVGSTGNGEISTEATTRVQTSIGGTFKVTVDTDTVDLSGVDLQVDVTKRIYFDAGSNTFLYEASDDLFELNVGGEVGFQFKEIGTEVDSIFGANNVLATTATNGFVHLPSGAGVPTGVPSLYTGKIPIYVDATNDDIYIYSNAAWNLIGGGGGEVFTWTANHDAAGFALENFLYVESNSAGVATAGEVRLADDDSINWGTANSLSFNTSDHFNIVSGGVTAGSFRSGGLEMSGKAITGLGGNSTVTSGEFRLSASVPITFDGATATQTISGSATGIRMDVPTGDSFKIFVNSVEQVTFLDTQMAFNPSGYTISGLEDVTFGSADNKISNTVSDQMDIIAGGEFGIRCEENFTEVNVVIGADNALATTAVDGFLYIPSMAGTPTGDSTDYTGKFPIVWDSSNSKLYVNTATTTWLDITGGEIFTWTADHDANGNGLNNLSFLQSNATNPAPSGAIRLGNNESISWRNAANDENLFIRADSSDQFGFNINGTFEWTLGATSWDLTNINITGIGNLQFNSAATAPAGTIQYINGDAAGLTFNVPTGDNFDYTINAATEYAFDALTADWNSNNITDMGSLAFDGTGTTAGNAVNNIWSDTGGLNYNVPTGDTHDFTINGTSEYRFESERINMNSNYLNATGNITFIASGGTAVSAGAPGLFADSGNLKSNVASGDVFIWTINNAEKLRMSTSVMDFSGVGIQLDTNNTIGFDGATDTQTISGAAAGITLDIPTADSFLIDINSVTEYDFSATIADFGGNDIQDVANILDSNGNELLIFTTTASAVNELTLVNSATGTPVEIQASGETNVDVQFTPKGTGTFYGNRETWSWPLTDETTAPTTGVKFTTEPAPYDMAIEDAIAGLTTAGTGAALFTIDILKEDTAPNTNTFTTIFSTKPTIDASEFTSTTAATAPVISVSTWEKGRRLQLSIDTLDTDGAARGAKISLITHATAK